MPAHRRCPLTEHTYKDWLIDEQRQDVYSNLLIGKHSCQALKPHS